MAPGRPRVPGGKRRARRRDGRRGHSRWQRRDRPRRRGPDRRRLARGPLLRLRLELTEGPRRWRRTPRAARAMPSTSSARRVRAAASSPRPSAAMALALPRSAETSLGARRKRLVERIDGLARLAQLQEDGRHGAVGQRATAGQPAGLLVVADGLPGPAPQDGHMAAAERLAVAVGVVLESSPSRTMTCQRGRGAMPRRSGARVAASSRCNPHLAAAQAGRWVRDRIGPPAADRASAWCTAAPCEPA